MTTTPQSRLPDGRALPRVVIVDDQPDVARTHARMLAPTSLWVDCHEDAGKALDALREKGADVIVCDIWMPVLNGLDFVRAVRAFDLDVPIIFLTGVPSVETARTAVELGAFRYLTKPVDAEELRAAVLQAAHTHRLAKLQRRAAALHGGNDGLPGDIVGLDVALSSAIASSWMAFQPIIWAGEGDAFSYEVLFRTAATILNNPLSVFDAAEKLGRLHEIGRHVRRSSAEALAEAPPDTRLFVNIHPHDLSDPELLSEAAPLTAYARRVVLEITERASLEHVAGAVQAVARLRSLGYRIAVDDLGSGYAGLTSIAQLEPEFVKIDMSLVRGIDASVTRQKLVRSMVDVCCDLGILVVAEGVETEAERDACLQVGAQLLQGYLIARPGRTFPTFS